MIKIGCKCNFQSININTNKSYQIQLQLISQKQNKGLMDTSNISMTRNSEMNDWSENVMDICHIKQARNNVNVTYNYRNINDY